jgi:nitrogen regulatory protein PII
MKLVVAIVHPEECETVQAALAGVGVWHLAMSEVWCQGPEPGRTFIYRSTTFREGCVRRLRIEVAVEAPALDAVLDAIQGSADTGRIGEGVVSVVPLERFVHIGNGRRAKTLDIRAETTDPVPPRDRRPCDCAGGS